MRRWSVRILLIAGLAGLGFWAWRLMFPAPEAVIRKRLGEVAQLASFASNEAPLAKLSNSQKLTTFFSRDAEIVVDVPNQSRFRISGQDELLQAALGARQHLISLRVEFLDINVMLARDKKSAVVNLTGEARAGGERELLIQELKFYLKRIEGRWLIIRIETVRTLTRLAGSAAG